MNGGGRPVAVAGAGLAGAMMACYLARDGYRVRVYERRSDPRRKGTEGGRSINLALSHRGIRALAELGLADEVLAHGVPMRGRMMHAPDGDLSLQPYGTEADQVIHSTSRGDLNLRLLDAAEAAGAKLIFDAPVVDVEPEHGRIHLEGGRTEEFDFIVGADGAYSAVRARLQRTAGFDYAQTYLTHGYKELTLPAAPDGGFALEPHALHIWPRGGFMMIALPNEDRTFTCTLFWPLTGEAPSFAAVRTDEDVLAVFRTHFADALPLFPDVTEQYRTHPVGTLVTVRCGPWDLGGRVILIGDAAHAVVPFYGQGMNASFEDCRLLAEALRAHATPAEAFRRFYEDRKADADALSELAIENYRVMRDRVASRGFLALRALGRLAHRVLPGVFVPLYTMVTFTSTPYAEAVARWERQVHGVRRAATVLAILLGVLLLLALR
ncbi:MAG: NAD(P)/FAD-dependent oxidoreductase [Gemmatimonadota bacterium]